MDASGISYFVFCVLLKAGRKGRKNYFLEIKTNPRQHRTHICCLWAGVALQYFVPGTYPVYEDYLYHYHNTVPF